MWDHLAGNLEEGNIDKKGSELHRVDLDPRDGMLVGSQLRPLVDEKSGYIVLGRSTSAHRKWRRKGLLQIGAVGEVQDSSDDLYGREVYIDAAFPHIVFICGKRGSGKSYTLGIFAEELIRSAIGVGVILVDPIGIFWSLKTENTSRSEKKALSKWGLNPTSFPEVKVLAPANDPNSLPTNCDGPFTIGINEMTAEDWCQVFDMDRFKTQGLLIGTAIDQVRMGYRAIVDDVMVEVPGRPERFSIGDIVQCIETSATITSKTGGYNPQTRRSIVARFMAAAGWGIFSIDGTPLRELTSPNRVTVLDISDTNLGDSKRSLITGIVARKVLEGRIQSARVEEHHGFDDSDPNMIPLTWLLIDEAHTILPHSRQTPASEALIEFAKQGRKPGCAMVLATQRPASTSDEILSQVDILIGHNLALEDDMSALRRRVPAKLPQEFSVSDFIRGIPVGTAIIADQKTQQRSFLMRLRPRLSHHAGSSAMPKAFQDRRKKKKKKVPMTGAYIPRELPSVLDPTPVPRPHEDEEREEVMPDSHDHLPEEGPPEIVDDVSEEPLPDLPWGSTILLDNRSKEDLEIFLANVDGARGFLLFTGSDPSTYILPQGIERIDRSFDIPTSGEPSNPEVLEDLVKEAKMLPGSVGSWVVVIDGISSVYETDTMETLKKHLHDLQESIHNNGDLLVIRSDRPIDRSLMEGFFSWDETTSQDEGPADTISPPEDIGSRSSPNGSLSHDELRWMCKVMGLPADGDESELLNRLMGSEPELMDKKIGEDIRIDLLKQVMKESSFAREENERLRSRLDELESEAGLDRPGRRKVETGKKADHRKDSKRLVLVWEDDEEQKEKFEDLIQEVEDLRNEIEDEMAGANTPGSDETLFSKLMEKLDEEKEEYRERLNRLENVLHLEMDSLRDELGEQRKQLEASRKVMKLRVVKEAPRPSDRTGASTRSRVLKKRVLKREDEVAAVLPRIGAQTALEIAKRSLKRSLLKGPRESIEDITPCYIQLHRFLLNYRGGIMKNVREADVYIDSLTGEVVNQGRTGLRRSEGLLRLIRSTDLEMDIIMGMGRSPRDPAWISKVTRIDMARIKRALSSLEKKKLVRRIRKEGNLDLYSLDDGIRFYHRPWSSEHGFRTEFVTGLNERMIPPKVVQSDAKLVLEKLSREITIIEHDIVRYPIYVVRIKGEGRTRYLAVDGVGGRLDRKISHLLKGIVENWE
ncbi:MAG: helicase HerA domain-containing protein [Thermoplasmatota archaeon]